MESEQQQQLQNVSEVVGGQQKKPRLDVPYLNLADANEFKFYEKKNLKIGGGGKTTALSGIERQIAAAAAAAAVDPTYQKNFKMKYESGAKRDVSAILEKRKTKGVKEVEEDKQKNYLSPGVYSRIGMGIYNVVQKLPRELGETVYVDKYGMIYNGLKKDGSRNYFSKRLYRDFKWTQVTDPASFKVKAALRMAAAYNFFVRSIRQYQRIAENNQVEFENFVYRRQRNAEPGLALYRRNMAAAKRYKSETYDQLLQARRQGLSSMVAKAAAKAQRQYQIINQDAAGFKGQKLEYKYQPPVPFAVQQYGGVYNYPQNVEFRDFNPMELFQNQQNQQYQQ